MEENKQRSLSQRIGEAGEAIVKLWASENCLSANKFDNDYGLDFLVQHFEKKEEYEIATGLFFLAQCKATEQCGSGNRYVKLEKKDAFLYLSSSSPVILLSVQNDERIVKFRFIDKELIDILVKFINGDNDSLNINIDNDFYDQESLQKQIRLHVTSSATHELKIYTVNKLLSYFDPSITLSSITTPDTRYFQIESTWLTNVICPDRLFSNEGNPKDNIIDINILEILRKYLPNCDALCISGSIGFNNILSGKDSKINTTCISYPYKGNIAFRTKLGFVLTAGPCIEKDGLHVHEYDFDIKPSPFSFAECRQDCLVFEEIFKQKQILIDNSVMIEDMSNFSELKSFLFISIEISNAIQTGIFDFNGLHASDINSNDVFSTLKLVTNIINRKTLYPLFCGFLLDSSNSSEDEFEEIIHKGKVPLVFSIKKKKFIAWLHSTYSWMLDKSENLIKGFKINDITKVDIDELEWDKREIQLPELWITNSWPAISLYNKSKEGTFEFEEENRPFEVIPINNHT